MDLWKKFKSAMPFRKLLIMKMPNDDFTLLKEQLDKYAESLGGWPVLVKKYENGDFSMANTVKDLQKRFCFDILYKVKYGYCPVVRQCILQLYTAGLTDDHIYSALRRICPTVTKKY